MGKVYQDCPFKFTFPTNRRKTGTVRYRTLTTSRPLAHVYLTGVEKTSISVGLGNPIQF